MFFGLFGKKKETEMPAAPMNDAGMNNMSAPMGAPADEKPMGESVAPTGAMPDNASVDGGDSV